MYKIINTLILYLSILSIGICENHLNIQVYCRDKNRLINSQKLDEYLLVDVEMNATLRLECHYCNQANDNQQKLWYFQDRYQEQKEQELEIGMNNNMSMNKIRLNSVFDVIIQDFGPSNVGVYKCHGTQREDLENKFNYRLEPVFEYTGLMNLQRGNLSDYEHYRKINLIPVTDRFAVSPMSSLSSIRHAGVILEVISEWSEWGPCECVGKKGIKTSNARCRLKSNFVNHTLSNDETSQIINFFDKSPILSCRSQLLNEKFPVISKAIKYLPEFLLEETCNNCKKIKKARNDKVKYKRRYTLVIGSYLTLVCPESNKKSHVVWQKEKTLLKTGHKQMFSEQDKEGHILIDTFSTLYLRDVTSEESGNYTCYVDDVKIMQVKVVVVSKTALITQALLRHMGYLAFILFIALFCYCAGIIFACKNPTKYAKKNYKMLIEETKKAEQQRMMTNWIVKEMEND